MTRDEDHVRSSGGTKTEQGWSHTRSDTALSRASIKQVPNKDEAGAEEEAREKQGNSKEEARSGPHTDGDGAGT